MKSQKPELPMSPTLCAFAPPREPRKRSGCSRTQPNQKTTIPAEPAQQPSPRARKGLTHAQRKTAAQPRQHVAVSASSWPPTNREPRTRRQPPFRIPHSLFTTQYPCARPLADSCGIHSPLPATCNRPSAPPRLCVKPPNPTWLPACNRCMPNRKPIANGPPPLNGCPQSLPRDPPLLGSPRPLPYDSRSTRKRSTTCPRPTCREVVK